MSPRLWLLLAGLVLGFVVLLREPLATHVRVWLLLSQQLPQIPIKPLGLLSAAPRHELVRFEDAASPIVADLLTPGASLLTAATHPALILALGVPLRHEDRPYLLDFADTLTRLGYVVLWPRSASIDALDWSLEEPGTFRRSVEYLRDLPAVDSQRISIFGISIGASIAMVAASDTRIADRVHALIAFGAYFDLGEYITSLVTRTAPLSDPALDYAFGTVAWEPGPDAIDQARRVLTGLGQPEAADLLDAPTDAETNARLRTLAEARLATLSRFNPADHLKSFRAKTFILHDRGDQYVPYTESFKLRSALPADQVGGFLLSDLFLHARVKGGLGWETVREMVALYGFAAATLGQLG